MQFLGHGPSDYSVHSCLADLYFKRKAPRAGKPPHQASTAAAAATAEQSQAVWRGIDLARRSERDRFGSHTRRRLHDLRAT